MAATPEKKLISEFVTALKMEKTPEIADLKMAAPPAIDRPDRPVVLMDTNLAPSRTIILDEYLSKAIATFDQLHKLTWDDGRDPNEFIQEWEEQAVEIVMALKRRSV